jgi:hypothetical protein
MESSRMLQILINVANNRVRIGPKDEYRGGLNFRPEIGAARSIFGQIR